MGDTLGALKGLRNASSIGPARVGQRELPPTGNRWADAGTVLDLLPDWMQPDLTGSGGPAQAAGPVVKATGALDDAIRGLIAEAETPPVREAARRSIAEQMAPRKNIGEPGAPASRPFGTMPSPSELFWQRLVNRPR